MAIAEVLTNVGRQILTGRLASVGMGPGATLPSYVGLGTSSTATATVTAMALSAEVTTAQWAGYARLASTLGQATTSVSNDTLTITMPALTNPASGTTVSLYELGVFDAASAGNLFIYATYAVINLPPGSSISPTVTLQFT